MDFLVKVGETGLAFPYTNIPPNEKISYLQTKIRSDTRIEIKDQVLITKKGHRLQPNDVFANLEKENQFQATTNRGDNPLRSIFTIYVFDQKKYSEKPSTKEKYSSYFMDVSDGYRNYLLEANIIDRDFTADFQSQTSDNTVLENIRSVNPKVLETDTKLFGHYSTLKKKFLQYKSKLKRLQRLMEENENQLLSFDVLLKHASLSYNPCKGKKEDVLKRLLQNEEKNVGILNKFEDGLENLKKIELHDVLKNDKQKFLIDIYYNVDAMKRWRNNCIELQTNVKNKIDKSSSLIKSIKEKLRDEKDKNAKLVRTQLQNQSINMDSLSHEEETLLSLVKKCYESYKSIREVLEKFSLQSDETNKMALSDPKWEELDMKEWEDALTVCNKNIEKIDKAMDLMTKMKINFELPIIVFYNTIMRLVAELNMISSEKMKQLNDEIDKMERDFSYLLNPGNLPLAYKNALTEISRRREFNTIFQRKSKKLKALVEGEHEKRKKFLTQFGRVLPSEFVPQLKNPPPTIKLENMDADIGLPAIDGVHQSETTSSNGSSEKKKDNKESKQIEELEKQIQEYKAEIQKLKGEDFTQDMRKRLESIMKEFENERDRNKLLKAKLNDMEKEQLNTSLRKGLSKEESTQQRDSKELQEDLEQLTRTVNKCLTSMKGLEPTANGFELGKENLLSVDKHQLVQRIEALNVLIEQMNKASLGIFTRKLNEKQTRFDDMRMRYEGLLMNVEESLQKETTKLEVYYEDKIKDITQRYTDSQKRVSLLLDDTTKYQKEITQLKTDIKDKVSQYQTEIDNIKKDVKIKLDLMKSKDEIIKSLTDMKIHLTKEIAETNDKMKKLEQKMKTENTEALANVHSLNKAEVDSFKARIKVLERDISNKNIELDKIEYNLTQSQKEVKQKEEHISKLDNNITTLNEKITKLHDEIVGYKNKIDNMELTLQKKTTELNASNKTVNQLTSDKNSLSNDLSTYKEFNGELTKKVQSLNELWKKAETERKNLKSENDRLTLDVEKKQVEIQNLNTQITKVSKERKEQIDELNKIAEDHQTERMKISSLQEELNQKNIEIDTLKTKLDLLSLDLENKVRENENLMSKFESSEKDKEKVESDMQKGTKDLEEEKVKMREIQKKLDDMKVICEQLQIEVDMKTEKCEGLKKSMKEMLERAEKAENTLAETLKQNQDLIQQSFEKSTASNTKVQEIKERGMQLEEEVRQRTNEVREKEEEIKTLRNEKIKAQEELQELTVKYESEKKSLKETVELTQAAKEEAENEKRIMEEFKKQEDSYKQEVENKQEEIEELKKKNEETTQEIEKIMNENFLFKSEISTKKGEIEKLLSVCQSQKLSKMDYLKIEKGAKLLFIPYSAGIYVPFILHQYSHHEIESVLKTGSAVLDPEVYKKTERSIRPFFFLDLQSLNEAYQKILEDCSMLIVGTVGEIKPKLNKNINPKEPSFMIGLEKIEYVVGFDDDDMIMKNYAMTMN